MLLMEMLLMASALPYQQVKFTQELHQDLQTYHYGFTMVQVGLL
jgi:hypothetical protein